MRWPSRRPLLALVAGGLTPLALAPLSWWPLAIATTAALLSLLRGQRPLAAFATAYWFGLGLFAIGASWVYVSIHDYGDASIPLAAVLTLVFVAGLAGIFALPLALCGLVDTRRPAIALVALPALWVLGEWWRGWILTGFPWLYLGYGAIDTALAGWAPVTGVLGISGIVAYLGALAAVLLRMAVAREPALTVAGIGIGVAALVFGTGALLQHHRWTTPASGSELTVALVQPAEPQATRWSPGALPDILARFSATTRALWDNNLIIWPESGIPRLQRHVQGYLEGLDAEARARGVGLITGIPTESAPHHYLNSALALGAARGAYHKRHLVPFGEYVPLEAWLRGAIAFFDLPMSAFHSGQAQQPGIAIGDWRVATAICYEVAYPDLVAADAGAAQLLLTLSNDTWFGNSLGPHQHMQMAQMRALENRKPLLRATNDGITALVDVDGRISRSLPQFTAGVLRITVTPYRGRTPFSAWGSKPVLLLCVLAFLAALWCGRTPSR